MYSKVGLVVYQEGGPEEKQTGCILMRRGKGWQRREIKLEELRHEGHIALER
jgi:hypothetical protein